MMPNRQRQGIGWEPVLLLILAAWYDVSDAHKRLRLEEQLKSAEHHGALQTLS